MGACEMGSAWGTWRGVWRAGASQLAERHDRTPPPAAAAAGAPGYTTPHQEGGRGEGREGVKRERERERERVEREREKDRVESEERERERRVNGGRARARERESAGAREREERGAGAGATGDLRHIRTEQPGKTDHARASTASR
eukprot:2961131-Rhodomonas_salina.1